MATESKLKRNFPTLVIIIFSGAFIYTLPYLRLYYYDAFKETFNMTNTQLGTAGAYFGIIGSISYILGGILSDKVSLRILMPCSMISTGLLGLYLLTIPSPNMVIVVHAIWAFTALMAFYPAMMKSIRMLGDTNEQARTFGLFEGGRGIVNAVIMSIAVALYGYFSVKIGNAFGIKSIILFYSSVTIILGVLDIFFLKGIDDGDSGVKAGSEFNIGQIGDLLKKPALWLMVVIFFCTYMINLSYYYFAPYATAAFGVSTVFAAMMTSSQQYVKPFSSIAGGFLGDKINSSKCLLLAQMFLLVGLIIILITPPGSSIVFIIVGCVFVYPAMHIALTMHFAIMEESDLPKESAGTAIGIICFLGYLPEAFSPFLAGNILDRYEAVTGYRIFFIILVAFTIVGIFATLIWLSRTKAKRAQILAINKK